MITANKEDRDFIRFKNGIFYSVASTYLSHFTFNQGNADYLSYDYLCFYCGNYLRSESWSMVSYKCQ